MTELRPQGIDSGLAWPHPLPVCWCLSDGRQGMENQAVGLAEALGLTPVVKRVFLKPLWRLLSPPLMACKRYAISKKGDQLEAPWPDMLIATGRPSILPSLYVLGQSGGRTFTVQLQNPVTYHNRFGRIVVPSHDGLRGDNVIVMDGSLHRISPQRLAAEAPRWEARFAHLPRPRVAVLLGGPSARFEFGPQQVATLAQQLKALAAQGFGLLVTGSRRTGAANMDALTTALEGVPAFISDGSGDNPYFGMLAHADAIIATGDSVNMVTEACSTGKPVHVLMLPAPGGKSLSASDKFTRFHNALLESGRTRVFDGRLENWAYTPLREMERVAGLVREAYLAHRSNMP